MKLLFATGNNLKYAHMVRRLKDFSDIEVIMPKQLGININVDENGTTAEENAIIKTKAFYDISKIPVIAEDSGLWIEKFPDEKQPGLHAKRIGGVEGLTDEQILDYYISEITKLGGESNAMYKTGVAIIDKNGKLFSTQIDEEPFLLTNKNNNKPIISGGVLDCVSIDPLSNKYFNELTDEDKNNRYKKIDDAIKDIVKQHLL